MLRMRSGASSDSATPPVLARQASHPQGNSGGKRLNQYTVTVEVMLPTLPGEAMPLFQTHHVLDSVGVVYVNSEGRLGTKDHFATGGPRLEATRWHCVSLVYDALQNAGDCMVAYIDGKHAL